MTRRRVTPLQMAAKFMDGAIDVHHLTNHEPSWWLRARLVDIDTRWTAGALRHCGHASQHPKIIALWDDRRAWCLACVPANLYLHDEAENWRCDRCSVISKPIHVVSLAGVDAVVLLGLCTGCQRREVAA